MDFAQQVSPPSLTLYATILLFFLAGPSSFFVSYYGWHKKDIRSVFILPLFLFGLAAIAFSISYSRLTIPWFPGYPIQSAEVRNFLFVMGVGVFSIPPTAYMVIYFFTARTALEGRLIAVEKERVAERELHLAEREKHLTERAAALSVLGHELRTPMALMTGFFDIMLELLQKVDLDNLDSMRHDIQQLQELTRTAVDGGARLRVMLKMYEAQTHDPLFAPVDICQVVYAAAQHEYLFTATHRSPDEVTIDVDCERAFPVVDARMIEAAVMEMVRNGLRAIQPGGSVWVSVRSMDEHCFIAVEDDGHGIAEEDWEAIWQPGKQLEHHMTRKKEGSGHGLDTLRIIAARHGGEAILEWSEVGKGSRFLLKLPMR